MPLATEGTQERLARVWEWFEASSYEEGVGVDGGWQGYPCILASFSTLEKVRDVT
jgi:hypothetical protein